MIYLLEGNQIISHLVNKSEIYPALSEIAKFISLSIFQRETLSRCELQCTVTFYHAKPCLPFNVGLVESIRAASQENLSSDFPTRSANRAVQLQKMSRVLKFRI